MPAQQKTKEEFFGPEQSERLRKKIEETGVMDKMSEEELAALKRRMEEFDRAFGQNKRLNAKYKIEVQFGKNRSTWKPFAGAMSLYLSGTMLGGGGDEKLYMCPRDDCRGVIFPDERIGSQVLCKTCEMMWSENDIVGEKLFNLTSSDWAHVILIHFQRLDHNADIYLKYHPTDIRYKTMMEIAKQSKRGEIINQARKNRGLAIYPLKHIIQDTKHGADMYKRFLAFVRA